MPSPLHIDGSYGEGGGQIVRSSLSLALVTGRPIVIDQIRAGRKKPGLLRQHLTALQAAVKVSDGEAQGDTLRSSRLSFTPGPVRGGSFSFHIGSAGSTTLVLQTVLPALMLADAPSAVFLEGGTHNSMAPPFDFLKRTFLPLLAEMGPRVELELDRYGFFPAGGGRLRAAITPASALQPLSILQGGAVRERRVRALVARLPESIGRRECRTVLRELGWQDELCSVEAVTKTDGPGNVVIVELEHERLTEVFTGFGQRGVRAEKVAADLARRVKRYCDAGVPVGEHLADQLLLPLAIGAARGHGGGTFRTLELSDHAHTQIDLLKTFLNVAIDVERLGPDDIRVSVSPA